MTIREFFWSEEKLAIHCDTKEKAKTLCNAFNKAGYRWWNGFRYIDATYWLACKEDTCYSNRRFYASREFYENEGYRIIEFEDIDLTSDLPQYTNISLDTPSITNKLVYDKLELYEPNCLYVNCKKITLVSKDLDLEIEIPTEKVEQFNKLVINGIEFERIK